MDRLKVGNKEFNMGLIQGLPIHPPLGRQNFFHKTKPTIGPMNMFYIHCP